VNAWADAAGSRRTRVKFCGITSIADALIAVEEGADAVGLILVPGSARALDVARAAAIAERVPPFVTRVALFKDAPADDVRSVLADAAIDMLQFHGDETPDYCMSFGRRFLRAVPMGALADEAAVARWLARFPGADGFVFDSHGGGASGGSGRVFDWTRVPAAPPRPVVLAGGLGAHNVAAAVRAVRPWAVDVSSGIESAPGIKDRAKMRAFIDEVHRAGTDHPP
jgi:phosphoribosylanthranilate isomerase